MGCIENALVTGVAVGSGHRALDDAEFLIKHLDHRGHAVGGAAGVAEDVPVFVAVLIGINSNHEGTDFCPLARCGENHLFGAGFEVLTGTHIVVEDAGGLNHQIHAPLFPGQVGWIAVVEGFDCLAVDHNRVRCGGHLHIAERAQH